MLIEASRRYFLTFCKSTFLFGSKFLLPDMKNILYVERRAPLQVMKFEFSFWLVPFLLISTQHYVWIRSSLTPWLLLAKSALLSQSESPDYVVSSAANEHTFWPKVFQSASLSESCFLCQVRFDLLYFVLFSSNTSRHDDNPSQWYACSAMLSNKNHQVWSTAHQIAGYNFSSQMVHLLT